MRGGDKDYLQYQDLVMEGLDWRWCLRPVEVGHYFMDKHTTTT
jgi:hypothetical protein